MEARTITITISHDGQFDVSENGKCAGGLAWDELLGQIACMTHPKICAPNYAMRTPDEWEEWRESMLKSGTDAASRSGKLLRKS